LVHQWSNYGCLTDASRCQVYADIDVEATRSLEPLLVAAEASDAAVLLGAAIVAV